MADGDLFRAIRIGPARRRLEAGALAAAAGPAPSARSTLPVADVGRERRARRLKGFRLGVAASLVVALLALAAPPASAQVTREEVREEIKQTDERRPGEKLTFPLGPFTFTLGGEIKLRSKSELNFDLDRTSGDDRSVLSLSSQIELNVRLTRYLELFGELISRNDHFVLDQAGTEMDTSDFSPGEVWIYLRHLFGGPVGFKVGRQDFEDARGWLYDRDLDAARLFVDLGPFGAELAVTQQLIDDVSPRDRDVVNYVVYLSYQLARRNFLDAYLVARDDRSATAELDGGRLVDRDDSDPIWVGLRSYGQASIYWIGALKYWLDAAHLTGTETTVGLSGGVFERTSRRFRAYGGDVGASFAFTTLPWQPSITAAFAFGTGDADPNDSVNTEFRQTGFQDNSARLHGVQSLKYYGELLDPELSNLLVYTAGLGVRPTRGFSIDLLAHRYEQHEPSTRLRRADIDAAPSGERAHLGDEIDLVVGWLYDRRFEIELALGAFRPGAAFAAPSADPAFVVKLEVKLNF